MPLTSNRRLVLRILLWDFKQWLRYGGLAVFVTGISCMPGNALTSPETWTSLFVVLAAAGFFARFGAVLMALGILLFCTSFLIRDNSK